MLAEAEWDKEHEIFPHMNRVAKELIESGQVERVKYTVYQYFFSGQKVELDTFRDCSVPDRVRELVRRDLDVRVAHWSVHDSQIKTQVSLWLLVTEDSMSPDGLDALMEELLAGVKSWEGFKYRMHPNAVELNIGVEPADVAKQVRDTLIGRIVLNPDDRKPNVENRLRD